MKKKKGTQGELSLLSISDCPKFFSLDKLSRFLFRESCKIRFYYTTLFEILCVCSGKVKTKNP